MNKEEKQKLEELESKVFFLSKHLGLEIKKTVYKNKRGNVYGWKVTKINKYD